MWRKYTSRQVNSRDADCGRRRRVGIISYKHNSQATLRDEDCLNSDSVARPIDFSIQCTESHSCELYSAYTNHRSGFTKPKSSTMVTGTTWAKRDRSYEDDGSVLLGATMAVTITALVTIVLRFYVRIRMIRNMGWDDYSMAVAMVLVRPATSVPCRTVLINMDVMHVFVDGGMPRLNAHNSEPV